MKFVSVIIPVLNEEEFLKERLTALQWLRNKYSEIIIVDGGSSDHSAKISAPMADTFLFSRKGRANQMNAGAKNARGEILLFLHSDTVFLENSFEELQKRIAKIDIFWGWFNLKFTDRSLIFSLISNSMRIRSSLTKICTGDQTLFVSAKLFNDIGGFPDIPLMEDIAISKMLKKESPPVFISKPVFSSVRRWESEGALKTILTMWWLRFQYWASVEPKRLAKSYYPQIDFSVNDTNKSRQFFKFPQINILLSQAFIGIITFFIFSMFFESQNYLISVSLITALFYQGVIIAGFGFIGQTWLLKKYLPSKITIISLSQPVFGVILAWLILGEDPGIELIFATILVVAGSYISVKNRTSK